MSAIERMIGRTLERERRAGVSHFRPGQYAASLLIEEEPRDPSPPELYDLSFVDVGGHAWYVLVDYDGGAWTPLFALRGGQEVIGEIPAPARLSEKGRQALEDARRRANL